MTEPEDVKRAVHWALARPGIFVNTASDLRILELQLDAADVADAAGPAPNNNELDEAWARIGALPLFTPTMDRI